MTTFILRNSAIRKNFDAFMASLPDHEIWEVTVKKHKKDMTSSQRNYLHQCIDILCKHTGDDPEEMKLQIKFRVLPLKEVHVDGKTFMYPVSSESATREQYSEMIDYVVALSGFHGVTLPSPRFYGQEI